MNFWIREKIWTMLGELERPNTKIMCAETPLFPPDLRVQLIFDIEIGVPDQLEEDCRNGAIRSNLSQ